jgi:hypothetical protein
LQLHANFWYWEIWQHLNITIGRTSRHVIWQMLHQTDLEGGGSRSLQYVLLNYQTINIFTAHNSIILIITVTRPSNLTQWWHIGYCYSSSSLVTLMIIGCSIHDTIQVCYNYREHT